MVQEEERSDGVDEGCCCLICGIVVEVGFGEDALGGTREGE